MNLFSKSIWQVEGLAKLLLYHRGLVEWQFINRKVCRRGPNQQFYEVDEETMVRRNMLSPTESDYADVVLPSNADKYKMRNLLNTAIHGDPKQSRGIDYCLVSDQNRCRTLLGNLEWRIDNPGSQTSEEGSLMTGSFQPLLATLWEIDAYMKDTIN